MKKTLYIMLLVLLVGQFLIGCKSVHYYGDQYAPTTAVKMFYSDKDVPANAYRVMGRAALPVNLRFTEGVVDKMRQKAQAVGADAVLIKGYIEIKKDTCSHGSGCQHNHPDRHELRAEFLKKKDPAN